MAAKMVGKLFLGKVASRLCRYSAGKKIRQNHPISHHFWDKCVFVFYAEIQDGCQRWQENDFWEMSPADSADTLWVKILSNSLYILHRYWDKCSFVLFCFFCFFLHFMQKFKMTAKNGWKTIFGKLVNRLCRYPMGQKICWNHSVLHPFRDKCVFAFYAEIQDGCQKWWEKDF